MPTVAPGAQIELHPDSWTLMVSDWNGITPGAQLTSDAASIGAFLVEDATVPVEDREVIPSLTIDAISFVSGSDSRQVQFRVRGGLENHVYRVSHAVETTESPVQRDTKVFYIWRKRK